MKFLQPILIVLASFVFLIFVVGLFQQKSVNIQYGVSFSPQYAEYLGLNWKEIYLSILTDLKVKSIRIPSYWNQIEELEGEFDFSETDFMVSQAKEKGAKLIFVLGERQPRWPECHAPEWTKNLTKQQKQAKLLDFITETVNRYDLSSAISVWQIENEPTLNSFGECDEFDADLLAQELGLVKLLSDKKIILTDSGELGSWIIPMRASDILGISLYREVHTPFTERFIYPFPAVFYKIKSEVIKRFFAPNNEKTIIAEFQAEPWLSKGIQNTPVDEQTRIFTPDNLKQNIEYGKYTGFDEIYLWGVEWWYFMNEHGNPEYLEYAKMLW